MIPRALILLALLVPACSALAQEPQATDQDHDGFAVPADCNDANTGIYPGAPEVAYDGIDQDCDGRDGTDGDYDGYEAAADCNDHDNNVHPGADETPGDGIDQNCDGTDPKAPWQTSGGGGGSSGGSTGGTTSARPALNPQIVVKWDTHTHANRVALMVVTEIAKGAKLTLTCHGRTCPFKKRTPKPAAGAADLTALFRNRLLRKGTVIKVIVAKKGFQGRTFRLVV